RDEVLDAADREVGVDPILDRRDVQLLQPGNLGLREALVREVAQGCAAPERKRVAELLGRLLVLAGRERCAATRETVLEPVAIQLVRLDPERVGGPDGTERLSSAR